MKKNFARLAAAGTLVSMLLSNSTLSAFAAANINVRLDGLLQPIGAETINESGYTLVEAKKLFEMFGAEVGWSNVTKKITVTKGEQKIILDTKTNKATVGNKTVEIEPVGIVLTTDGKSMIPLRFAAELMGGSVEWDEAAATANIKTDTGKYVLLNDSKDISEDTELYSFDGALELARSSNSSLKNIEDSLVYLDDLRDDLGQNMHTLDQYSIVLSSYPLNDESGTSDYEALQLSMQENIESTISVARGIKEADMRISESSINEEMINDSMEISLRSYLTSIRNYEMNIKLLEENIKLSRENIENMQLKYDLGMESAYNLNTEKNTLKQSEISLENLKLSLENQYHTLRSFMGIKPESDIYVEYNAEFDALDDVNLESYIAKKKESDPQIKLLKNAVELAKYNYNTSAANPGESETKTSNELKTAQRNLKDSQDAMDKNIRVTYNTIKLLEENNKSLLLAVEQAKEDYNSVVSSYQADRSTIYQVNMAKLGILKAEQAVEDNELNYAMNVYMFNHPYLISSSSAS